VLFARLARAVAGSGARVCRQTTAAELITDQAGRVTGVACRTLRGAPAWARTAHQVLHRLSEKPWVYAPKLGRLLHRPVATLEQRYGRPLAVVLALAAVVAMLAIAGTAPAQEKKRRLLVIGQSKGYQHESISTAMVTPGDAVRNIAGGPNSSGVKMFPYGKSRSSDSGESQASVQTRTQISAANVALTGEYPFSVPTGYVKVWPGALYCFSKLPVTMPPFIRVTVAPGASVIV